jgi:hypothetical protein
MAKSISNMFSPITNAIDLIARIISPIFQWSFALETLLTPIELLTQTLELLGTAVLLAQASISGLFNVLFEIIERVKTFGTGGQFDSLKDAFDFGVQGFLNRNADKLGSGQGVISNQVTNIGKVEIKNEFRENQEPDRIAFSLQKQLLKTAQAPTQARGRGFSRGSSGSAFGGQ